MKIAFVLFDGMTTLDFAGFYEAVTWLRILGVDKSLTWDFCSNKEQISDDRGLKMKIDHIYPDLSGYDLVFIPGGGVTRQLRYDSTFISWLRTARDTKYRVSVCTGALLLGAAGFLEGKKATTNSSAYDLLTPYCAEVSKARIVRDGNIITAGGVSASLDLGLYMVEMLAGADIAQTVQDKMEYPYYRVNQFAQIRPLERKDQSFVEAMMTEHPLPFPSFIIKKYPERWEAFITSNDVMTSSYYVSLDIAGTVLGHVGYIFNHEQNMYEIVGVVVKKGYQSRGLGKALIQSILEKIRALGGSKVILYTLDHSDSQPALSFYKMLGFHITLHEKDYFTTGYHRVTFVKDL